MSTQSSQERSVRNCLTDEGRPLGCAKKKERCKLHAVREMRAGPSKPLCRERLQTATSCCGTMAMVVNVVVKRRGKTTSCMDERDERKRTSDEASKPT